MRCRYCGGATRVVTTVSEDERTMRWLRCLECEKSMRTIEEYYPKRPGPKRGTPANREPLNGSSNPASVLTEADVKRLRALSANGISNKVIAQKYGIALGTVSRIINRKTWKHI